MLNFGNKCRVFVSPAASQASIESASDLNTKLNEDRMKQLEDMSKFESELRLRFATGNSIDSLLVRLNLVS